MTTTNTTESGEFQIRNPEGPKNIESDITGMPGVEKMRDTTKKLEVAGEKVQLPVDVSMDMAPNARLAYFVEHLEAEITKQQVGDVPRGELDENLNTLREITAGEEQEVRSFFALVRIMREHPGAFKVLSIDGPVQREGGSNLQERPTLKDYMKKELGFENDANLAVVTTVKDLDQYQELTSLGVSVKERYRLNTGGDRKVSGVELNFKLRDGSTDTINIIFADVVEEVKAEQPKELKPGEVEPVKPANDNAGAMEEKKTA